MQLREAFGDIYQIEAAEDGQAEKNAVENAQKNANLFSCLSKPWNKEELIAVVSVALK